MSEGLTPSSSGLCGGPTPVPQCPWPVLCVPSTVLLLNPVEVQAEFLAVANQLSTPGHSPHSTYTTLLLHAFQATFGPHCDLPGLHCRLQVCARGPWAQQRPLPAEGLSTKAGSALGSAAPPPSRGSHCSLLEPARIHWSPSP